MSFVIKHLNKHIFRDRKEMNKNQSVHSTLNLFKNETLFKHAHNNFNWGGEGGSTHCFQIKPSCSELKVLGRLQNYIKLNVVIWSPDWRIMTVCIQKNKIMSQYCWFLSFGTVHSNVTIRRYEDNVTIRRYAEISPCVIWKCRLNHGLYFLHSGEWSRMHRFA